MPKVTFIAADGVVRTVDVVDGLSVMEAALTNGVPGIDGDCGGNCACATCHLHVDSRWLAAVGARSEMEEAMLENTEDSAPGSRLAYQITMSDSLDGLVVRTPLSQH